MIKNIVSRRLPGSCVLLVSTILLVSACSGVGQNEGCDGIIIQSNNCLVFEAELGSDKAIIEQVVRHTISTVNAVMATDNVQINVIADPMQTIPELGIGGFTVSGQEIRLFVSPTSPVYSASLSTALFPMLAHELHHAARMRSVGYGSTLFEAIVSEGLADHFSIEVAGGDPPPWSKALTESELETWTTRAAETWHNRSYNHSHWFFGTNGETPRWTGYAIGYQVIDDYLSDNPGVLPSNLFDDEAATFLPN